MSKVTNKIVLTDVVRKSNVIDDVKVNKVGVGVIGESSRVEVVNVDGESDASSTLLPGLPHVATSGSPPAYVPALLTHGSVTSLSPQDVTLLCSEILNKNNQMKLKGDQKGPRRDPEGSQKGAKGSKK